MCKCEEEAKRRRACDEFTIRGQGKAIPVIFIYYMFLVIFIILRLDELTRNLWVKQGFEDWLSPLIIFCALTGALLGVFRGLTEIFQHYCRTCEWKDRWMIWYIFLPAFGAFCGLLGAAALYSLGHSVVPEVDGWKKLFGITQVIPLVIASAVSSFQGVTSMRDILDRSLK